MRVACVGGGAAGLFFALRMKQADPRHEVVVYERNRLDDTFGFGVVFSDATQTTIAEADPDLSAELVRRGHRWDDIEVHFQGTVQRSTGHGFSGVARTTLLDLLARRCRDAGVDLRFQAEVPDPSALAGADLLVGADGANSAVRQRWCAEFRPALDQRPNRFVWLGTTRPFPAFTFYFKRDRHGLWRVHAYQYDRERSTFIVEATEATWRAAGLDRASEADTVAFCQALFAEELEGHRLLTNKSVWRNFVTIRCERWSHGNVVLLGDAAHTAHFSVGSGTRLAMEDAVALAAALGRRPDVPAALAAYEAERRPAVEGLQRAAQVSLEWFEGTERYAAMEPLQFFFSLLTRSLRVSHGGLARRDPALVEAVDHWFAARSGSGRREPALAPFELAGRQLPNRLVAMAPGEVEREP
ncbi:MAG TPA: FAD-dependent monooxygenase, partial [Gemmatimonadales bacterium]|nr:FAD-dependent monooxygenase [Gemmatimonadales bacterium]